MHALQSVGVPGFLEVSETFKRHRAVPDVGGGELGVDVAESGAEEGREGGLGLGEEEGVEGGF